MSKNEQETGEHSPFPRPHGHGRRGIHYRVSDRAYRSNIYQSQKATVHGKNGLYPAVHFKLAAIRHSPTLYSTTNANPPSRRPK